MKWAGAHILALVAVSILVGFGKGGLCHLGSPPRKAQVIVQCGTLREGQQPCQWCVPLGSHEQLCLCPLQQDSHQRFALLEAVGTRAEPL